MKYFGTDGIRLENTKELQKIAMQICYAMHKFETKNVVIGRDSRISGSILSKTFLKNLKKLGLHTYFLGIVPTACVAYYTKQKKADFGIVITASHNTANINGIKIFSSIGEKIDEKTEKDFEFYIDFKQNQTIKNTIQKQIGITKTKHKKANITRIRPVEYEKLLIQNASQLNGKKIVLDCANGAARKIAPKIFKRLGADVTSINTGSGKKINLNCGAVFPNELSKKVLEQKAILGFAFDGDADRCVCVLSGGEVLSGDNILFALGKELGTKDVVGTIYSNGALDKELEKKQITLHRSNVGDQEVKKLMNTLDCSFGGERSGHFIFSNILPTGDGILTALQICKIKDFEKKCKFKKMPSITKNIKTDNKQKSMQKLEHLKEHFEQLFGNQGRIVLRPSGTENLVRIFVEHKKIALVKRVAKALTDAHEKE